MGCGRVGATLATGLDASGHSVAVLDQRPEAFRKLPESFDGQRVTGVGFDRDALSQTGIEDAYGFAAVSSGDNSNILAARVVRETFGVANVVARIYDPRRAEVYERLGIPTVATVRWTADQVVRRLVPLGADAEHHDASGRIALVRLDLHHGWLGRRATDIERATGARLAYLTRLGVGTLPEAGTVLQQNDVVHALVEVDRVPAVQRVLAQAPVT